MLTLLLSFSLLLQPRAADESAAFAAQDARFAAMVKGDTAFLEGALDEGLTYHHSTGAAQTKSEFINAIKAGGLKYKSIDVMERRARKIGSVTIVTGIYHLQAISNSDTIDTKARFTDIYESRGGKLVEVAWQNTRIP